MLATESKLFELKSKKVFFFDLDGTIYLGNKLFDDVLNLIDLLRKKNNFFFFLIK